MMWEPGNCGPSQYEVEKDAINKKYDAKIKNPPWYSSSGAQQKAKDDEISQLRERLGIRGGGFYE